METPFTHYTYQPTGGDMTKKQVVEMARQQCRIMSFGSGKFTERQEVPINQRGYGLPPKK